MEKMRTLLALLLKKISTPGRLKKLGFGTRLIDDVLKESISGKKKVFFFVIFFTLILMGKVVLWCFL